MKSPRDNLLSTLHREGYSCAPIHLMLCPSQLMHFQKKTGNNDYQSYFQMSMREITCPLNSLLTNPHEYFRREKLPKDTVFNEWGVGYTKGSEDAFHMRRAHHPLKGEDVDLGEIQSYPFPAVDLSALSLITSRVNDIHSMGLAAIGRLGGTIWETTWSIRGMEDLMMDMMNGDEKAEYLLDRVFDVNNIRMKYLAKAGCDIIWIGDDIGMQRTTMMSVDMWETWLKPRIRKIIASGKSINPEMLILYHSDGYIIPFLEGLIEVGIDILNPVQPESMQFKEIHRLTGDRLSYWGTIGTQTTLPFGTPDDVKKEVNTNLEICGNKGGIVIAPTHIVEPEVPWENIEALVEAAANFRGTANYR